MLVNEIFTTFKTEHPIHTWRRLCICEEEEGFRSLPDSGIAWTILSFSCVTDFSGITGQGESSQTMKESWPRKRQSLSDN